MPSTNIEMPRRVVVALAAVGAVLVLGIVLLIAMVVTLSDRPSVETERGVVVNISSSRDAIAIKTSEGKNLSGPLAVFDVEAPKIGDRVTVKVIDDPNVVVVVKVRPSND